VSYDQRLPESWARLHPLSPVAKGGRALVAIGAVTAPRQLSEGGQLQNLAVDVALAVLIIGAGVVSWLVTRWRVHDGELQLDTGLLRRQSIRVPLERVQAVDLVRPLAARLLGISELRLVMAGSGSGKARLSFLTHERAEQVRAQLLALGAGLHAETPEAPEHLLTSVPNGRLVGSALLGLPILVLAALVPLLVVLAVQAPEAVAPVVGATATALFASFAAVVRRINVEFSFSLAASPDGLRIRSGMLQTRAETIPGGRIQGVRLVEPLLWRPLGWCRLEVDVAQQHEHEIGEEDVRELTRALLPVGDRAQADLLLRWVLPGAQMHPPVGSQAPRRTRYKAPLSFRRLASWHDGTYLAGRTGRLQAETVVVPLAKAQSIRWTQGPLQRRMGLASVHVDTAGRRWHAVARDRSLEESLQLLSDLPAAARAARGPTTR
jgi:putative membrane protein